MSKEYQDQEEGLQSTSSNETTAGDAPRVIFDPASDLVSSDRTLGVASWSQSVLRNVELAFATQVIHDRRTVVWFSLQLYRAVNSDTQILPVDGSTTTGQACTACSG